MARTSYAHRKRRHALLLALLDTLPRPLSVLDVGGTAVYWQRYGVPDGAAITLLNTRPQPAANGFTCAVGDACAMPHFADGQFDMVFSNSVIEHVGDWSRQQAMASEVRRVGRAYFVQTPARSFPLEPHFSLPYFQYWPMPLRLAATRMGMRLGRYPAHMETECRAIRLLSAQEMARLFPGCTLWRERIGPLTKSFVAYAMWQS